MEEDIEIVIDESPTLECKNPRAEINGDITLELNHPTFGWISFTASPNDSEAHGRDIFAAAQAGLYGEPQV